MKTQPIQHPYHIPRTDKAGLLRRFFPAILLLGTAIALYFCLRRPAVSIPTAAPTELSQTAEQIAPPQPVTDYLRISELVGPSPAEDAIASPLIAESSGSSASPDAAPSGSPLVSEGLGSSASPDAPQVYDMPVTSHTGVRANPYTDLSVPTWLTKMGSTYFLVDCYHNQVIYNDNLTDPLGKWKVMTSDIDKGHTLASDGSVYLIDDTERNRVLVFEKKDGVYAHTQTFENIGTRPHYIVYHAPTDTFYAWSSMTGEMYLFRHNPDDTRMYLTEIRKVDALDNVYVRSFTIIGNEIYFVSGNSAILRADLKNFQVRETYPVPDSIAGMVQLTRIQDYYYITVSTDRAGSQDYATILRARSLSGLAKGEYEDIYHCFIGGGTPYYITELDNAYYLTEHRLQGHSLWRFQVENNEIVNVGTVY